MEDTRARSSGNLLAAIFLLHPPLLAFIRRIAGKEAIPKKQPDFADCLKFIRQHWEEHFSKTCPPLMRRMVERAKRIRNLIAHQGATDPERALETLARLATAIQREDLAAEIRALGSPNTPQPVQTAPPHDLQKQPRRKRNAKKPKKLVQQPEQETPAGVGTKKTKNKKAQTTTTAATATKATNTSTTVTKGQWKPKQPPQPPQPQPPPIQPQPQPPQSQPQPQPQPQPLQAPQAKPTTEWQGLKEQGNAAFRQDQFTEAMNFYTRALALAPQEAVLYSNRALCELRLKKFQLAREDAEDAIELDPGQVKYHRLLSESLYNLDLFSEATTSCKAGLELDPRDEVLLLRLRDCESCVSISETDKNPRPPNPNTPGEWLAAMRQCGAQLQGIDPLPEDIRVFSSFLEFMPFAALTSRLAEAHNYAEGMRGAQRDPRKAFQIFEEVANKGSAEGIFNVGQYFLHGDVVPRDFARAIECFRKAAKQECWYRIESALLLPNIGVRESYLALGNAYRDGSGVDVDLDAAFKWYLKAAQNGVPHAQNNLGVFLWRGMGRPQDGKSARIWFERAAKQGLAEAQLNYADVLCGGIGGPEDPKLAMEYYEKAANMGVPFALEKLRTLARGGALGSSAAKKAADITKGRAKEDPEALFLLGNDFFEGTSEHPRNVNKALELWEQAARKGHVRAACLSASAYLDEKKEPSKGFQYMLQAADAGDANSQMEVARLYAYGHGCSRDEVSARRYHNRAVLGGARFEGDGGTKSPLEEWLVAGKSIVEFEAKESLGTKGLTLRERCFRYGERLLGAASVPGINFAEIFEGINRMTSRPTFKGIALNPNLEEWLPQMLWRASQGSVMAQAFLKSASMIHDAILLIDRGEEQQGIALVLDSYPLWEFPLINDGNRERLLRIADKRLNANPKDREGLLMTMHLSRMGVEQSVIFLEKCIQAHPLEARFHHRLACMYGFQQRHQDGLREINRALQLSPDRYDWLYERASFIRLQDARRSEDVIAAYQEYLDRAPKDDRKVPEAHYCLGSECHTAGDVDRARKHFLLGCQAEDPTIRLPCFLPVEDFPPKFHLSLVFNKLQDPSAEMTKKTTAALKGATVGRFCDACGRPDPGYRCTRCKKVAYCSRDCQQNAWQAHKLVCRSN